MRRVDEVVVREDVMKVTGTREEGERVSIQGERRVAEKGKIQCRL